MEPHEKHLLSLQSIAHDIVSQERSIPVHDVEDLMREHNIWWSIGAPAVKSGLDVSRRETQLPEEFIEHLDLGRYKSNQQFMAIAEDHLTLYARKATALRHMTHTSAASLFLVEHQIEVVSSQQNIEVDKPSPQPLSERAPLKMTQEQQDTLELLIYPKRIIAAKLNITRALVTARIGHIKRNNQLDSRQVVLLALRDGHISIDELPNTTPLDLNEQQQEMIRDFSFKPRREISKHFGISENQVTREWQLIHALLGTRTEVGAFALAYRDTLVTIDS